MNRIRTIASALCIAFLASAAHAEGYNLRGPGLKVGDTVRSETVTKMTDGTMDINAGTFQLAGKTNLTANNITETTILKMEDGKVTKVQVRFVSDSQEQIVEMMGQRNSNNTTGPLNGKTIIGTQEDGAWKFEMEEGTANREQQARLQEMGREYRFTDRAAVAYPDRKVKIGESWDVDASELHSHFGGAEKPQGKLTYTLDKVEEVDGEKLAYITVVMDFSAKMTGEGEGTMSMKGKGPLIRSLKSFLDKSSEVIGTMQMEMSQDEVKMVMKGPMTVTAKETRP